MKCVICGSTRHELFKLIKKDEYIHVKIRYYKCSKCGLVFIKPQPLKKLKKLYPEEYRKKIGIRKTLKSLIPFSPRSVHLTFLKRHGVLQQKGDLLDIGSAHGRFLYLLKLRGWNVLGVEPTKHYAEFARRVLGVPTITGFFENVKLDKKFDLITMIAVFEHISDPIRALEKIKRLLKENGRLYIYVPSLKTSKFYSIHLFMYTKDTLTRIVRNAGFVVEAVDITTTPHAPDRIRLLARLGRRFHRG